MENKIVLEKLHTQFGEHIKNPIESFGMLTIETSKENFLDVLKFMRDDAVLQFNFMTDLCGAHYPDREQKFEVIYHMHSWVNNVRVRIKVALNGEVPKIPTACFEFPTANWMERETYDFYGIIFEGHPNLKRILNVDDLAVFPMRKEFPLEDNTRTDKRDDMFGR